MKLGFKSEGQVLPDNIPQTDLMNIIKVRLQAGVVGVVGYAGREGGRHRTGGVVGEEKTRSRGGVGGFWGRDKGVFVPAVCMYPLSPPPSLLCPPPGLSSNLMLALSPFPTHTAVHQTYNDSPDIHGILVQLPLPDHLDQKTILAAIDVEKDVDGFHPMVRWMAC